MADPNLDIIFRLMSPTLEYGDTSSSQGIEVDETTYPTGITANSSAPIDGVALLLDHPLLTTSGEVSTLSFSGSPSTGFVSSLPLEVSGSAQTGTYSVAAATIDYADGTAQTVSASDLQNSVAFEPSFAQIVVSAATTPVLTGFSVRPSTMSAAPSLGLSADVQDSAYVTSVLVELNRSIDVDGDNVYVAGTPHSAPQDTPTAATISNVELTAPPLVNLQINSDGSETFLSPEQQFLFTHTQPSSGANGGAYDVQASLKADDFGEYTISSIVLRDINGGQSVYSAAQLRSMGVATSFAISDAALLGTAYTTSANNQTLAAPVSGQAYFEATGSDDAVRLNGNVGDYTLSRVQPTAFSGASSDQVGAFLLAAKNGSGTYAIEEGVSTVQFQNGQFLSLHDLPAYIQGDATLIAGRAGADLLYQAPAQPYELFYGGAGNDTVYLNGNVHDYTLQPFTAVTPLESDGLGGDTYSGLELVANNGSGDLLIDSSVETVQFKDGQYLSYGDLHSYIAGAAHPSSATLDIGLPDDFNEPLVYGGTNGANTALLNGAVGDYTLSRDLAGDFVLDEHYATDGVENTLTLSQDVTAVQFRNGQFLSLKDLGVYVSGSDVFTQGTAGNDILFTPNHGDSYVVGGAGTDDLYLTGNARDYTIQAVDLAATTSHPAVDGYELVADNGSGDIYIDQSTEVIHFLDGQYLAFHDLPAYVEPFHG